MGDFHDHSLPRTGWPEEQHRFPGAYLESVDVGDGVCSNDGSDHAAYELHERWIEPIHPGDTRRLSLVPTSHEISLTAR